MNRVSTSIRSKGLLVVAVAVVALAVAATLLTARFEDQRSQEQRDYEAVSKLTKPVCFTYPELDGLVCPAPNSKKADLSVIATATRTGNNVTIKAVIRNHKWANATASRFRLSAVYHPGRPKRFLEYRSGKLESGLSAINCRNNLCEFPAPVPPGQQVALEMTLYAPDGTDADLGVYVSTLDTYSGQFLELHHEDNRIVVPVVTTGTNSPTSRNVASK
jgi:hypothetical protein